MKLFAVYIGGRHPQAHIEIHDMRFVAAPSIRDTYDALRSQWWGTPGTLHIDCWAEIDRADGYDVMLRPDPSPGLEKLYYVNMGGYDPAEFTELHKNMFVVAGSERDAKARAKQSIADWKDGHRDDFYEAEQVFALDTMLGAQLHIHLARNEHAGSPGFTCSYMPLARER